MTSSRLLAAGDCILVFSVGLGPVDQIIGQGVRPGRQWQRVHRDGRSARFVTRSGMSPRSRTEMMRRSQVAVLLSNSLLCTFGLVGSAS